jgi:hypothetical protein
MEKSRTWFALKKQNVISGFIVTILVLCLSPSFPETIRSTSLPTLPIDSGFGAKGQWETSMDSIVHPKWEDHRIYLFSPKKMPAPAPVILFCHGIGAENPLVYMQLIRHMVSWGNAVMYSPYPRVDALADPEDAYKTLWSGFEAGMKAWSKKIDRERIGILGHSFGGGAVPSIAWRALMQKKWGSQGSFMYIMAPWYSYNISFDQLSKFPKSLKLIVETFDDDRTNDPRMAMDLFRSINIPDSSRCFIKLYGDTSGDKKFVLLAGHDAPEGTYAYGWNVNAIDYYGIYRPLHALSVYAFTHDSLAGNMALGRGQNRTFMGLWNWSGAPVKPMHAGDAPDVGYPEAHYVNFWSHAVNPRAKMISTFSGAKPEQVGTPATLAGYAELILNHKTNDTTNKGNSIDGIINATDGPDKQKTDHASMDALKTDTLDSSPIPPIKKGFGALGPYTVKSN